MGQHNQYLMLPMTPEELQALLKQREDALLKRLLAQLKPMRSLLSRREAMALLNISYPTILKLTKERKLNCYRINSCCYYKPDEIESFIESSQMFNPLKSAA